MCVCVCVSCSVMSNSMQPHGLLLARLFLSVEFPMEEYWSGLPFPSPGDLPDSEIKPKSPALQADSLMVAPPVQFSHSVVSDSATPWTVAHQASLSITNSWSLLKLMPIESVMPFNHLILCHPLSHQRSPN